jgi:hypothetical protein
MSKNRKLISVINDYSCLYNKCSEFLYQPIDHADAFAIRRGNYESVMRESIGKKLRGKIAKAYKYIIQEPLHEHRDEMAQKYQNRIDYVNLEAYGAGKVNLKSQGDFSEEEMDEFNLDAQTNTQARILNKIGGFAKKTDAICESLSGLAFRQDEGILRLAGMIRNDDYQNILLNKVYSLGPVSAKSPKSNSTK